MSTNPPAGWDAVAGDLGVDEVCATTGIVRSMLSPTAAI
jgi:hypothetical protein